MKVISLTQPWATLMAIGEKCVETRSWSTPYRGSLAIAAAKGFPSECRDLCMQGPFAEALRRGGYGGLAIINGAGLPLGEIVAVVDLVDCLPTDGYFVERRIDQLIIPSGKSECVFGNYARGRYGWITRNLRRLARPIPAKGRLGLWEFPDAEILAALGHAPTPSGGTP